MKGSSAIHALLVCSLLATAYPGCSSRSESPDATGSGAGGDGGNSGGGTSGSAGATDSGDGGTTNTADGGDGSTAAAGGSAAEPSGGGAPAGDGGDGGSPAGGAAGGAGGGPGDTFLEHCALAEVESGSLCIENVTAQAGDEIDVEIWLVLPESCDWTTQLQLTFTYDADNLSFEDEPIEDFYDGPYQCVLTPAVPPATYVLLKLSASAQSGCPEQFTPGLHAILRATVAVDAPPGDYALTISNELVGDNLAPSAECRSQADQMHWHGIVRVVE